MNTEHDTSLFAREVLDKTIGAIRTFLAEIANGSRQYLTIHNLTEQIEHQYHERFVIELLQNAHDALRTAPPTSPRRVEFVLDRAAGSHGVLYVANDGMAFRSEDLRALANLGQSSKDPRESIGNKGIGFRSVLEVCHAPEIYSCAGKARRSFDGYCFRFTPEILRTSAAPLTRLLAGDDTVAWLLGDQTIELDDIRAQHVRSRCKADGIDLIGEFQHLSPYLLPLPISPTDVRVGDFARRGFATVVRLPLISPEAQTTAIARLGELDPDTLVFLDGLKSLTVDDGHDRRCFVRKGTAVDEGHEKSIVIRCNGDKVEYLRWDYVLRNVEVLRTATAKLPGRWKELTEAPLGIAVRVRGQPVPGRFFIYLPTEVQTGTAALLNAPFFGEMSRKAIDFNQPLNKLLRATLTEFFLVDIVRKRLAGRGEMEAVAIVDLLAPVPGIVTNCPAEALESLRGDEILLTDRGWRTTTTARLVPLVSDALIFTKEKIRACAQFDVVHSRLDQRRPLVAGLFHALGASGQPSDAECAATVAAVAAQHNGSWRDFWRDVEELLPNKASVLDGHRVLVDDQGVIHPAGGSDRVQVFFPRPISESASDLAPIEIPPSLKARIAFLSSEIPLLRRRPDGREEYTSTRRYLESLVETYRVETILRAVLPPSGSLQPIALTGPDAKLCEDLLDLVVRLLRGAREFASLVPELRRLRLPCLGGWFLPEECIFGPGWPDSCGDLLNEYLKAVATQEAIDTCDRLLLPPDHPTWRGHGSWLREILQKVAVRDGLFPSPPPAAWRNLFSMQSGAEVNLPSVPVGFSPSHWDAYIDAARAEIKPYFSGSYLYKLLDVLGIVGLDTIETLNASGRRALTLLLFRSIHRFPKGWQQCRFRKTSGNSHEDAFGSFLRYALRTLPWIWCDEDGGRGVRPSDRWFVRSTTESSQRRQFEHLRPLPPDLTREIVRLDAAALQALIALGMPVLDLDVETNDPRLLIDLASALAQDRVPPAARNIFLGQVRDAWRVFSPNDQSHLPSDFVVQRAGRGLEVQRPSEKELIYLPDIATRGGDMGPFGALPLALMETRDAIRLLPVFQRKLPGHVRALSTLRTEVMVAGTLWTRAEPATRLMGSPKHWLATLALAVSAFAGSQAHGVQTKEFKQRLAAMRAVSVESMSELAVRVVELGDAAVTHRSTAVWDATTKTILYDTTMPNWLEALAGPLAQALDRVDVVTPLRYALSKLPFDPEPEVEDLDRALAAIDVTSAQFAEVRQLCTVDHAWICERLRPAVALLAPEARWDLIETTETGEALESCLAAILPADITPASLIESARESRDDRAMGTELFTKIGDRAELGAWNAVLDHLGSPYRALANTLAAEQFSLHRQAVQLPFRAVARHICANDSSRSFTKLADALRTCPPPPNLAMSFWVVPFRAATGALAAVFDGASLAVAVRDALIGKASAEELVAALALADAAIEPTCDPTEVHRENVGTCQKVFESLRRIALAWCDREKVAVGRWPDAITMPATLRAQLDSGEGFLVRWSEHKALVALSASAFHEQVHATFWDVVAVSASVDALRQKLALGDKDLTRVEAIVEAAHERTRRAARTMTVCGAPFEAEADNMDKLWDHLAGCVQDSVLPVVDPNQLSSLAVIQPSAKRPPGRAANGGKHRSPRPSEAQTRLIGLTGEIFAYRMLRKHFGEVVVSPSAWVSENSRHRFPQNQGDDGLGYDFQVVVGRKTWLIEVKATTGRDTSFELGPTEVQAAIACARSKQRVFRILHVQEVLSSSPIAIFLPNPFSEEGRSHFQLDEAGLFVRYLLAK